MKTKWHKRFDAEAEKRVALRRELDATDAEFKRLTENYREQIDNLSSAYADLNDRYNRELHDGWAEVERDEQVAALSASNVKLSERLSRVLAILLGGEDPDEVHSDPA